MTDYTDEDLRKVDEWDKRWIHPLSAAQRLDLAAFRAEARREEREANLTLLHEASGLKLSLNDMLERAHEQGRMMERQSEREACERIVEEMRQAYMETSERSKLREFHLGGVEACKDILAELHERAK